MTAVLPLTPCDTVTACLWKMIKPCCSLQRLLHCFCPCQFMDSTEPFLHSTRQTETKSSTHAEQQPLTRRPS
jgi:hypothetical protein